MPPSSWIRCRSSRSPRARRSRLASGAPASASSSGAVRSTSRSATASSNGSTTRGTKSRSSAAAAARTASPASTAPAATAAATPRCESTMLPRAGSTSIPASRQQPLEQQSRRGPRAAPSQTQAVQIAHRSDGTRVAARQHQALLAPTQMHERHRLVAEQTTHERVVVGAAGDIEQVHERKVRLPARQTVEPGHAATRPRIGSHLLADGPQDQIERWVVGAAQANRARSAEQHPRPHPRADHHPRARTVTARHQPERLQAPVGADHGARGAPRLRSLRPHRRHRRALTKPPFGDFDHQRLRHSTHHLRAADDTDFTLIRVCRFRHSALTCLPMQCLGMVGQRDTRSFGWRPRPAWSRPPAAAAAAARRLAADPDHLGRRVAEGRLHDLRPVVSAGQAQVQLRRLGPARRPDPPGREPERVRVGQHQAARRSSPPRASCRSPRSSPATSS